MKDEIKEIDNSDLMELLETTSKKEFYRLTIDHKLVVRLYNWITNLQEKYDKALECIDELKNEVDELNKICDLYGKSLYNAELTDYKSRNEKARKMIKFIAYNNERPLTITELNKVYNILGGDE